jgi:hypothetical protein
MVTFSEVPIRCLIAETTSTGISGALPAKRSRAELLVDLHAAIAYRCIDAVPRAGKVCQFAGQIKSIAPARANLRAATWIKPTPGAVRASNR